MIEMEAIILSFYKWELFTRGIKFDSNFTLLVVVQLILYILKV